MRKDEKGKVPQFVKLIDRLITDSDLNQREIAELMGLEKPNIITMYKQGSTRVPLMRVGALARALNYDPAALINLWLKDYEPEMKKSLDEHLGMVLTANERKWMEAMRERFPEGVPALDERFEEVLELAQKKAA